MMALLSPLDGVLQFMHEHLRAVRLPYENRFGPDGRACLSLFVAIVMSLAVLPSAVRGFTPQSKQVRAMIDRSMAYLAEVSEGRWGGKCLIALAFLKERQNDHAKVAEALAECQRIADAKTGDTVNDQDVYSLGLGVILLCELDSDLYRREIEILFDALWRRQSTHGAWGYPGQDVGDTSMTQYAVLALWTAHRAGIDIRQQSVLDVCQWLVKTQDVSGGFGYHPDLPTGEAADRQTQQNVRESTSVAGLGSLYACSTLLGANQMVNRATGRIQDVPAALIPVPARGEASLDVKVSRGLANEIKRALNDGNKWHAAHFTIAPQEYPYYYLYGLERYHAFRSFAEGKKAETEPGWYNQGVQLLGKLQQADGRWSSGLPDLIEDQINTTFAVLFLMRSTQKALDSTAFGEGLLIGGQGLPSDTRRIRMVDGRVVSQFEQRSAAAIARILSDPDSPDFEQLAELEGNLIVESDMASPQDQEQLRRIVVAGTPRAQLLAIRALGTQRNLDNVPALIKALGSEDPQTADAANEALCRIRRQIDGAPWPAAGDRKQRQAAIDAWKGWYKSIRPDARLVDDR